MLKAATYNLRHASEDGPNAWSVRRPVMRALLESMAPDVLGTQEGLHAQLLEIAADWPGYDWVGVGREGGNEGEFAAVFFRTARLEALEVRHVWMSNTPDVAGSKTWGNHYVRMATLVRFRQREDGRKFWFWNAHLDHEVAAARKNSALLLAARARDIGEPLILAGDFNVAAGDSEAYTLLEEAGFRDVWLEAPVRKGPEVGTFHNYQPAEINGPRIDWILTRGAIAVREVEIVTFPGIGQQASDHFPVTASLEVG